MKGRELNHSGWFTVSVRLSNIDIFKLIKTVWYQKNDLGAQLKQSVINSNLSFKVMELIIEFYTKFILFAIAKLINPCKFSLSKNAHLDAYEKEKNLVSKL